MLTAKEILTREEVMEILKIGRSTFYKLLQTGELKGFKEGNRDIRCRLSRWKSM